MKLLYASGFSMAEKKSYRRIIFSNILNSLRVVLEAMVFYEVTFEIEGNKVLLLAHCSTSTMCSPRMNKC
jgi:guanine nucleotide-binding protein G(i) subunit alpha